MSKRKYKVGNYEVSYKTLQNILGTHKKRYELLNKIQQGKEVKATLKIGMIDKYFDDGYQSEGERQALSMYGVE